MKLMVTVFPTNLVVNLLLSLFLSILRNEKLESDFQQVGGLVKKNISVFCS